MNKSKLIEILNLESLGIKNYDLSESEYITRDVSRGIILKEDKIAFVKINSMLLPGGGVEEGETFEEALKRECMEELGINILVKENIGHIFNYRYQDEHNISKKYFIECYVCDFVEDLKLEEKEGELVWLSLEDGLKALSYQYNEISVNLENNSKLFNLKTHILFLKEFSNTFKN
jgi:8-oxo-dGTP diphosphatase